MWRIKWPVNRRLSTIKHERILEIINSEPWATKMLLALTNLEWNIKNFSWYAIVFLLNYKYELYKLYLWVSREISHGFEEFWFTFLVKLEWILNFFVLTNQLSWKKIFFTALKFLAPTVLCLENRHKNKAGSVKPIWINLKSQWFLGGSKWITSY